MTSIMGTVRGALLSIALCSAAMPALAETGEDDVPDMWDLQRAGLDPLPDAPVAGVQVQRISGHAYLLSMPSIELRRNAAGQVDLTIFHMGNRRTIEIDPAQWDELKAMSAISLAPYDEKERKQIRRHLHRFRKISCHGEYALAEAQFDGRPMRRQANSCAGPGTARPFRYIHAIARLALGSFPECRAMMQADHPSFALMKCASAFGWKATPEYRDLESRYDSRQR